MTEYFMIFLGAAFVNNFVLSQFLGVCPFLGVSKKTETALGMGIAVTFVMTLASAVTYIVYKFVLVNLEVEYLYNIAFILIIASLVQLVEMFIKKSSPTLYNSLGIFLPLITTNCAVLGVTINNMESNYSLMKSIVNGIGAAVGFTIAIVLFAGIREKLEKCDIPLYFRGFPIALITAGLMAMAFMGFGGLIK